jgi:hypothetical protein
MTLFRRIAKALVQFTVMTLLLAIPILAQSGCISLGGASCHGTADACHGQLCANVLNYGCAQGPGCFGSPCPGCSDTCASYNQVNCSTHATDCSWDPRPTSCVGAQVKASCEAMGNEDDCGRLSGCVWGTS